MPSAEHESLRERIAELTKRFVDFDIPLERMPTICELDQIAAFKLLTHSEFETYIEGRILYTIEKSVEIWRNEGRITKPLLGVLLRWYNISDHFKSSGWEPKFRNDLTSLFEQLLGKMKREVLANNGIKREAFSRLCFSIGVVVDDLPSSLLIGLENYGVVRGEVAHNAIGKVRSLNDPRVEAVYAKDLVDLLVQFDELLNVMIG